MSFEIVETLDANALAFTSPVNVTTEKEFQLYVFNQSGSTDAVEVVFEVSPNNGSDWMQSNHAVLGVGYVKESYLCTNIRAAIRKVEGSPGQVKIALVGR